LVIVNSAAMNMSMHVFLLYLVLHSFEGMPKRHRVDHMVVLFLVFGESPYWLPQWPH
jgi:hypothetical protein